MTLALVLALAASAKPPAPPQLDEIAAHHGLEAAWKAFQEMPATYPKAKHLDRARSECGLERIQMPVQLKLGAELVLSEPSPLQSCSWTGEQVDCQLHAAVSAKAAAEDYQVSCRTSFGATLPLTAEAAPAPEGRLGWTVHGVQRCWEIDAVGVRVAPVSHDDLEGIGKGDDYLIPPELAALSKPEADEVIEEHLTQFKYCYQRYEDGPTGVGKLQVRYHIAEDGTVDVATIEEATFTDERVHQCIVERFERLRFPPPMEGWTGGTFPFTFQR